MSLSFKEVTQANVKKIGKTFEPIEVGGTYYISTFPLGYITADYLGEILKIEHRIDGYGLDEYRFTIETNEGIRTFSSTSLISVIKREPIKESKNE